MMVLFKLYMYLAALLSILTTTYATLHHPNHATYRNNKPDLQKRGHGPEVLPKAAASDKPKNNPTVSKSSDTYMSPEDWDLWDKFEVYFTNTWKVPRVHYNVPVSGAIPNYPIPGQNGSGWKKSNAQAKGQTPSVHVSGGGKVSPPVPGSGSPKSPVPGQSATASKKDGGPSSQAPFSIPGLTKPKEPQPGVSKQSGSDPLPFFPVPGLPDPLANSEPVPGNAQAPVDESSLQETPANPGLPTVEQLMAWLDNRFPNGRDSRTGRGDDIRYHLMFWSGGPPGTAAAREARRAAAAHQWYVMADLFTGDRERRWTRFIRTNTDGGRNYNDIRPMWRRMALAMARWARGRVRYRIYDQASATNPDNTWNVIERPTLMNRGITIDWVDREGRARGPEYPPVQQEPSNPPNGTGPPTVSAVTGAKVPKIPIPMSGPVKTKLRRRAPEKMLRRDLILRSIVQQIDRKDVDRIEKRALMRRRAVRIIRRIVESEEAIWL